MKLYYKILNLNPEADLKEIRKSYKRLALIWHPDRNSAPEAEDKFKEIAEAYEVLSDSNKKKKYDSGFKFTTDDFKSPFEIFHDLFPEINPELLSNLNDIIDNVTSFDTKQIDFSKPIYQIYLNVKDQIDFSNSENLMLNLMKQYDQYSQEKKKSKNDVQPNVSFRDYSKDLTYTLNISLEDYYLHHTKDVTIEVVSKCYICNDQPREKCYLCKGHVYYLSQKTYPIPLQESEIILSRQGNHLPNSIYPGTLSFYLDDKPHSNYKRLNDYDLLYEKILSKSEIDEKEYKIAFLDGTSITLNNISQIMNTSFRIPNKGLIYKDNHASLRGDLYIFLKSKNMSKN